MAGENLGSFSAWSGRSRPETTSCSAIARGMNNILSALVEWYNHIANYIH